MVRPPNGTKTTRYISAYVVLLLLRRTKSFKRDRWPSAATHYCGPWWSEGWGEDVKLCRRSDGDSSLEGRCCTGPFKKASGQKSPLIISSERNMDGKRIAETWYPIDPPGEWNQWGKNAGFSNFRCWNRWTSTSLMINEWRFCWTSKTTVVPRVVPLASNHRPAALAA